MQGILIPISVANSAAAKAHPATYTEALLPTMARMLTGCQRVLDPMAGTGKVFLLEKWLPRTHFEAIELEPEWAAHNARTRIGNCLFLPWDNGHFDAICVSPPYGNRMADQYVDGSHRNTYRHYLDRPLSEGNAGAMQWGPTYRLFHSAAWVEACRVLTDDGTFVLNCKNHIRGGKLIDVTQWHVDTLTCLGFSVKEWAKVAAPGNRHGANGDLRVDFEDVVHLQRTKT